MVQYVVASDSILGSVVVYNGHLFNPSKVLQYMLGSALIQGSVAVYSGHWYNPRAYFSLHLAVLQF